MKMNRNGEVCSRLLFDSKSGVLPQVTVLECSPVVIPEIAQFLQTTPSIQLQLCHQSLFSRSVRGAQTSTDLAHISLPVFAGNVESS